MNCLMKFGRYDFLVLNNIWLKFGCIWTSVSVCFMWSILLVDCCTSCTVHCMYVINLLQKGLSLELSETTETFETV